VLAGAALVGAAAVVGAAVGALGAAELEPAADELLLAAEALVAAEVLLGAGAGSDEQAAATASTAVPEAASTVRRGRVRGTGVMWSLQGLSVAEMRPAGDGCLS
jgi:hypothetical protein